MKNINVPSYNSLLPTERRIRSIQELYDYISSWKKEVDAIEETIPSEASSTNQLATRDDVATSSATYRGSYNLVSDLNLTVAATESDVAAALATTVTTADNNDYVNVQIPSSDLDPTDIVRTDRYKFNGTGWIFEYSQETGGGSCDCAFVVENVASGTTAISAELKKYYNIAGDVGTLAITLPAVTNNTKLQGLMVAMATGTTPNVTITASGGATVSYFEDYSIEASTEYELNFVWNGSKWIVAYGIIG